MLDERYVRGLSKLSEIDGNAGEDVIKSLEDICPDLGKYIIEFAFGDIYCRDELDLKQRELITIASLVTQGSCKPQLKVHINAALNVGITVPQVVEAIIQCCPYIGFPKVLNGIEVLKEILKEK